MSGVLTSLGGALLLAALSTFGDFVWARFVSSHRMAFGLLHGTLLCLAIGLYLGSWRGRALPGALGGAAIGLGAAAGFYALARWLGYGAMLPCWMALWLGFAFLEAGGHVGVKGRGETVARGVLAALGSGLAFHLISGIWTRPSPTGPNYPYHFLCWTVAFLPGFMSLLFSPAKARAASR